MTNSHQSYMRRSFKIDAPICSWFVRADRTPTFFFSEQLVCFPDDITLHHAVRSYFELPALWTSANQPLPVSAGRDDLIPFRRICVTAGDESAAAGVWERVLRSYRFVFEPLALDEEIHAAGAVRVRPADSVDRHAAEASTSQGQPPAAGVVPSHDHCSHTRITVTAKHTNGLLETETWLLWERRRIRIIKHKPFYWQYNKMLLKMRKMFRFVSLSMSLSLTLCVSLGVSHMSHSVPPFSPSLVLSLLFASLSFSRHCVSFSCLCVSFSPLIVSLFSLCISFFLSTHCLFLSSLYLFLSHLSMSLPSLLCLSRSVSLSL